MKYFIIENGQQAGPFTIYELKDKGITSDTLVWAEGMSDWQPAWKVEELKNFLYGNSESVTPPPVPPTAAPAQPVITPEEPQPKKKNKVGYIIGIVLVVILLLMCITNPSKDEHINVIKDNVEMYISEKTQSDFASQFISSAVLNMMGGVFNELDYHNYLLFSTTTIHLQGKDHRTSIGFCGKVLTADADDIDKMVDKTFNVTKEEKVTTSTNGVPDEQVTDSSSDSIEAYMGKKIIGTVGNYVKDKVKEETDSTTSSGIGKLIDDIIELINGE